MIRLIALFLTYFFILFASTIVHAEVFFYSDFERGETHTAEELSPNQHRIRLVPNWRLDEWPQEGGKGIIEGNLPLAMDTFTYVIRSGPVLKGVRGITREHPQWADIRTGDLMEWYTSEESGSSASQGKIEASRTSHLFGNYSAKFKADSSSKINLAVLPPENIKKLFIRFYTSFSPELVRCTSMPWRMFKFRSLFRQLPALNIEPSTDAGPYFDLGSGDTNKVIRREVFPSNRIHIIPGKKYCVEFSVDFPDTNQATLLLSIDQVPQVREFSKPSYFPSNVMGFLPTPPGNPPAGDFMIDEFICSDSMAGPLPEKPELQVSGNEIKIVAYPGQPPSVAVQWQAHTANSWLFPFFNGGRSGIGTFLTSFSWPGILANDTVWQPPEKNRPYYTRVRLKNEAENWSEWSVPVAFYPVQGRFDTDSLRPRIGKVFLAKPGSRSALKSITAGNEYDLYVYPSDPKGWSNLGYCDVYLCYPAEEDEANFANRGGIFYPGKTFMISYSLEDGNLWEKHDAGTEQWSRVTGRNGLYVNDSGRTYAENRKQGWAMARIRLPKGTRTGPLLIKAFAANDQGLVSPMQSFWLPLSDSEINSRENEGLSLVWLVGVGVLMLLVGLAAARFFKPNTGPPGGETAEKAKPIGVLEFDSPYDENIKRARDFILSNYQNDISLEDVASAVGVSKGWLGKFFVKATKKKVSNYINEVRIDNAKKLLVETKLNIGEIAFKTGFNSLQRFAQVFNELTKQSAGEYREANRK